MRVRASHKKLVTKSSPACTERLRVQQSLHRRNEKQEKYLNGLSQNPQTPAS